MEKMIQQQKETKIPLVRGYFLSYYWNTAISIRMKKKQTLSKSLHILIHAEWIACYYGIC